MSLLFGIWERAGYRGSLPIFGHLAYFRLEDVRSQEVWPGYVSLKAHAVAPAPKRCLVGALAWVLRKFPRPLRVKLSQYRRLPAYTSPAALDLREFPHETQGD